MTSIKNNMAYQAVLGGFDVINNVTGAVAGMFTEEEPLCEITRDNANLCGSEVLAASLPAYFTSPKQMKSEQKDVGVIVVHDIFGFHVPNCRYIVDHFAAQGFPTLLPNFFNGKGLSIEAWPATEFENEPVDNVKFQRWYEEITTGDYWLRFKAHGLEAIEFLRAMGCKSFCVLGFSWGGLAAQKLAASGAFASAASLHGCHSSVDGYFDALAAGCQEITYHTVPGDTNFPASAVDALRAAGAQVTVWDDMHHGFAVRAHYVADSGVRDAANRAIASVVGQFAEMAGRSLQMEVKPASSINEEVDKLLADRAKKNRVKLQKEVDQLQNSLSGTGSMRDVRLDAVKDSEAPAMFGRSNGDMSVNAAYISTLPNADETRGVMSHMQAKHAELERELSAAKESQKKVDRHLQEQASQQQENVLLSLQERDAQMERALQETRLLNTELDANLADQVSINSELQMKRSKAERSLQEAQRHNFELQDLNKQFERTIEEVQVQNRQLHEDKRHFDRKIEETKALYASELRDCQIHSDITTEQFRNELQNQQSLDSKLTEQLTQHTELTAELQQQRALNFDLQEKYDRLREQLGSDSQKLQIANDQLQDRNSKLEDFGRHLTSELQQQRTFNSQLREEHDLLREKLGSEALKLQSVNDHLQDRNAKLEDQHSRMSADLAQQQNLNSQIQEKYDLLREQLSNESMKLQNVKDNVQQRNFQLESEIQEQRALSRCEETGMEISLREAKLVNMELEESNADLQEKLQNQRAQVTSELQEQHFINSRLRLDIGTVSKQLANDTTKQHQVSSELEQSNLRLESELSEANFVNSVQESNLEKVAQERDILHAELHARLDEFESRLNQERAQASSGRRKSAPGRSDDAAPGPQQEGFFASAKHKVAHMLHLDGGGEKAEPTLQTDVGSVGARMAAIEGAQEKELNAKLREELNSVGNQHEEQQRLNAQLRQELNSVGTRLATEAQEHLRLQAQLKEQRALTSLQESKAEAAMEETLRLNSQMQSKESSVNAQMTLDMQEHSRLNAKLRQELDLARREMAMNESQNKQHLSQLEEQNAKLESDLQEQQFLSTLQDCSPQQRHSGPDGTPDKTRLQLETEIQEQKVLNFRLKDELHSIGKQLARLQEERISSPAAYGVLANKSSKELEQQQAQNSQLRAELDLIGTQMADEFKSELMEQQLCNIQLRGELVEAKKELEAARETLPAESRAAVFEEIERLELLCIELEGSGKLPDGALSSLLKPSGMANTALGGPGNLESTADFGGDFLSSSRDGFSIGQSGLTEVSRGVQGEMEALQNSLLRPGCSTYSDEDAMNSPSRVSFAPDYQAQAYPVAKLSPSALAAMGNAMSAASSGMGFDTQATMQMPPPTFHQMPTHTSPTQPLLQAARVRQLGHFGS